MITKTPDRTPLYLLLFGIALIALVYYLVNKPSKEETVKPSTKTSQTGPLPTPPSTPPKPQKSKKPDGPAQYSDVFKKHPKPQTETERITQEKRVREIKAKSSDIIAKTNTLIKEKNLTAPSSPADKEKIEKIRNQIETLKKKTESK